MRYNQKCKKRSTHYVTKLHVRIQKEDSPSPSWKKAAHTKVLPPGTESLGPASPNGTVNPVRNARQALKQKRL